MELGLFFSLFMIIILDLIFDRERPMHIFFVSHTTNNISFLEFIQQKQLKCRNNFGKWRLNQDKLSGNLHLTQNNLLGSTDQLQAAEWLLKLVPASRIQPSRNVLIIYSFLVLMNCSPMTNFLKHAHCCLLVSDFPQQLSDLRPGSDAELFISRTSIIRWTKYMKSSGSKSIRNAFFNLERLSRSFRLARPGISPLERLWSRRRTFHVPNIMHKLLQRIL